MKSTTRLEAVCEYIFETEWDDFLENLSHGHIYYVAYAALYGEMDAKQMLAEQEVAE